MTKIPISLLLCSVCFISTFFVNSFFVSKAFAVQNIDNVDALVNQDKLNISVTIAQDQQQIVGQALVISIEVATDRWFATGSRVQSFALANTVMQANNIITINGSKRIKGQTWAMQTHEITLYPTLVGNYKLPSLNVDISINTENNGIISGVLSTQETSFTIVLPEELEGIDNFIVSPEVTLGIDGQFDTEKDYVVGDAITQTITITASDIPAMMIPKINAINDSDESNAHEAALDGISIYHRPAQIFDKSNRGSLLGSRVESFTYIFEKAGSYALPEHVIYWWNSQSNTLEELVIPASSWTVSGGGQTNVNKANYTISDIKLNLPTAIVLIVSLFALVLAYLVYIQRLHLIALYKKMTNYEQRQGRKQFLKSITKQEYLMASQYLYQYMLYSGKYAEVKQWPLVNKLNKLAFQADSCQKTTTKLSIGDAKTLIKKIDILTTKRVKHINFKANETIKLYEE